jgi:catechol 2,3-dioxygenase-like lactoylglutathione lyase family enzyme
VKLPVSNLAATRTFYRSALEPLGFKLVWDQTPTLGFGRGDGGGENEPIAFELTEAPIARCHVAFDAETRDAVDAFHASALAAGGTDHGAPGDRPYGPSYYAAFVLDPDGHNIEAVYKGSEGRRYWVALEEPLT